MAEDNKQQGGAQAKLGELFVDIGSSGLGSLIKGLNTVSASFLLTKNAATQALKPIIQMSQKGAQTVTHYDKLSAVMGLSWKQLQELRVQAELSNVSFDELVGQLQNLQQQMIAFKTGRGGKMDAWAMLGISPRDLSDRNPMQALDLIMHRAMQLEPQRAAYALRELGISQDLLFFYQQQNKEINKGLYLNDENVDRLREQQDLWNRIRVETGMLFDKIAGDLPIINSMLRMALGEMDKIVERCRYIQNEFIPAVKGFGKAISSIFEPIYNFISPIIEFINKMFAPSQKAFFKPANMFFKWSDFAMAAAAESGRRGTSATPTPTITQKSNTGKTKTANISAGSTGVPTGQLTENSGLNNTQVRQLAQNFDLIPESELKSQGIDLSPIMPAQPVKNVTNTNNVTVTINQNIASTDPAGAGRESAAQMNNAVKNTIAERSYLPGL